MMEFSATIAVLELIVKTVVGVIFLGLISIAVGLLFKGIDRKVHAHMQSRVGPPIIQPFRDVRKLLYKQSIIPENAIDWIFCAAPIIALASSILILLYIPLGSFGPLLGGYGDLILIAYLLIIPSLAMVVGGFASGSPYATVGAQREMVQMISYELPFVIVIIAIGWRLSVMTNAPFDIATIMANPIWNNVGVLGGIGALLLLFTLLVVTPGELAKIPFDAPEAETEICGGLLAEYSGRHLAMFYLADAVKTVVFGAIILVLFFPYNLSPLLERVFSIDINTYIEWVIDFFFFLLKLLVVVIGAVTFPRTGFSRLKIDQIVGIYWRNLAVIGLLGLLLLVIDMYYVL